MSIDEVSVKAFSLPAVKFAKKNYVPVVVQTQQGYDRIRGTELAGVPVMAGAINSDEPDVVSQSSRRSSPQPLPSHPTKITYLVDISSSMADGSGEIKEFTPPGAKAPIKINLSKLALVQDRIKKLADAMPANLEQEIIAYDDTCRVAVKVNNPRNLVDEITKLQTGGSTNIYDPIKAVIDSADPKSRNLAVLISDGQITAGFSADKVIELIRQGFPPMNIGIYPIGVGIGYDQPFMRGALEAAKFGGAIHIPEADPKKLNVFGFLLPTFIKQLQTAPLFPIVSFNYWFDKVVNLNPSIRDVQPESIGSKLAAKLSSKAFEPHYPATIGYQYDGFAVGFIEEDKFAKASVNKIIQTAANGDVLEVAELPITPIDEAVGLDPEEQELIKRAPLEALASEIIKKGDPIEIEQFLKDNPDLAGDLRERLQKMLEHFKVPEVHRDAAWTQNTRAGDSISDMSFGSMTQILSLDPKLAAQLGFPINQNSGLAGETYAGGGITDQTAPVAPAQQPEIKPVKFKLTCVNDQYGKIQSIDYTKKDNEGNIVLEDPGSIVIGRDADCGVVIEGDESYISSTHIKIFNKQGSLTFQNAGKNTWHNGERLSPSRNRYPLNHGDTLKLGNTVFNVTVV